MANTLAYGFVGMEHLLSSRVSKVGVSRIFDAIRVSAAEHTRQVNGLLGSMMEMTTIAQEQFELPGGGTLQPLDEFGNPLPMKPSGSYTVGYPIQGGGTAWGTNRVSRELLTVEEANRNTLEAMRQDADWVRRHALASIFDNVSWTFNDKVGANGAAGLGNITIQPLCNGDTVTYVKVGGAAAVDTHHLAQAAAIADATNPFDTIRDELLEHPSNTGPLVCYVASDLKATIEALTSFKEVNDNAIRLGADSDELVGAIDRGPGDEVVGYITGSRIWIVEWRALPSTYMICHARGGGPVIKMREYPSDALSGFFMENHSPDGNLALTRMLRYAGFGVANRVGAVVMRIGNASYAIPSGYDAPLAV